MKGNFLHSSEPCTPKLFQVKMKPLSKHICTYTQYKCAKHFPCACKHTHFIRHIWGHHDFFGSHMGHQIYHRLPCPDISKPCTILPSCGSEHIYVFYSSEKATGNKIFKFKVLTILQNTDIGIFLYDLKAVQFKYKYLSWPFKGCFVA